MPDTDHSSAPVRPFVKEGPGALGFSADSFESGLPLSLDHAFETPRAGPGLAVKRFFDLSIAMSGLVALLPLFVAVAICVKLSGPGPVFFRQEREGRHGRPFDLYKFRSMHDGQGDQSGIRQTADNDPRITLFGRVMRRTSIDELPQLINVVLGDMSLVGPRPHVAGMLAAGVPYRELVPYYECRLAVRPGLTGWAQVNGLRGPTTDTRLAVARVHHDLAYIQNWSLGLDGKILLLTLWRELVGFSGS